MWCGYCRRMIRPAAVTLAVVLAGVSAQVQQRSADADELHETGIAHHLERSLNEAAEAYDRALALDPPRDPNAIEWRRITAFAPRVFAHRDEPFALTDVAAILHPDTGSIAYHLFWEDDIDFPDDNEPSDHEVVWVQPSRDGRRVEHVWTYFHGRLLEAGPEAIAEAQANGGRAAVYVQWGKHGSMPRGWQQMRIVAEEGESDAGQTRADVPITLLEYNRGTWKKLATEGRRAPDNPLARRAGWPDRFPGSWDAFQQFTRSMDLAARLARTKLALVSRWNSGPLNRWLVRYNFRPKTEWPDGT
jgi:hypothetical protein